MRTQIDRARAAYYQKKWRERQPQEWQEANKAYLREWHAKNREKSNADRQRRYEDNKTAHGLTVQRNLDRIKSDPVLYAKWKEQRRISKRERVRGITVDQWAGLLDAFGFKCAYCGDDFDESNIAESDHIIPVTLGGPKNIHNIVPACRGCNARKQRRHIIEFLHDVWGVRR